MFKGLKWRHVSIQGVIIRPIIEMFEVHQVKVHILGIPKCLQQCENVKNVHFHLMYLIHGSVIGLMMTP